MLRFDVYSWLPDYPPICISPGDGAYFQSCIHPDGDHAIFWGGAEGLPRLWCADLDGNECIPLTTAESGARQPSYRKDGKRIVFISDCGAKQAREALETIFRKNAPGAMRRDLILHVYTMNADGSDIRQITDGPVQDLHPTFSPDGKTICFFSVRGGSAGLWLVSSDGLSPPQRINSSATLYRPVWSHDGNRIYGYCIINNERHQIGWVDPVTGAWAPLANDDIGQTHSPSPDPNGKVMIAHSTRRGRWSLCEIPLDGITPVRDLLPKGFENTTCAHPCRAANGFMTFDSSPDKSLLRYTSG